MCISCCVGARTYTNGNTILITDIGEGDDALLCMTGNTECCDSPDDGEFFYPDGTAVGFFIFEFLIQEQRGTSGSSQQKERCHLSIG